MIKLLSGYKGRAHKILQNAQLKIGDYIKVTKDGKIFKGFLMPRYELGDDKHIVIKLENGYNVGIQVSSNIILKKIGKGVKPSFKSSKIIKEREDLPTVAILGTGGTIASRIDYRTGAVHSALSAIELCSIVPELSEIANIHTEIIFNLFSENIQVDHWIKLAKSVANYIKEGVDGVVICHGTDTMGYTSAALSFALQRIPVPVILVGSQRSSDRPSSDAAMNLINVVRAAARSPISEVMVCMHETISDTPIVLHRGTKVRKCHTSRRDAFRSINIKPLARIVGSKINLLSKEYIKRDPNRRMVFKPHFESRVALLKFYPSINPNIIKWFVENHYLGIVFEGTGLGHVSEYLLSEIKNAINQGLVFAMTSQCIWGRINMNVYATGMDLQKIGVIPLGDMLPETALIKMMWAFGQIKNVNEVKKIMLSNITGEISKRSIFQNFI